MAHHPSTIVYNRGWFHKDKYIKNIPEPCCILVDTPGCLSSTLPNIFIQVEPDAILSNESYLINNKHRYHTIITFNQNILNNCSNARKYLYGTTFILETNYNNINTSLKDFKISTMAGAKNDTAGHKLRLTLHNNQSLLKDFPITFYRSIAQRPHIHDYGNNPFIEHEAEKKFILFEGYQFAIIIENSKQINYFTEKIMDCLLTKTIPIYWGCPNISNYFDTTGWIILETETIEELKDKLKILTHDYYSKYADIIEKNYLIAKKYIDLYENINNAI